MGAKTEISWSDATWTPLRARVKANAAEIARAKGYTSLVQIAERMAGHVGPHCERVSAECTNCYSETNNGRCLPANGTGLPFDRRSRDLVDPFVDEKILVDPLKWRTPKMIFVCSQTDPFGEWLTDEMIDRVFAVMALCPQHTFQVLTKRPIRLLNYMGAPGFTLRFNEVRKWMALMSRKVMPEIDWPLSNVWLGVSVGIREQKSRIDVLRETPTAVRFLSIEPLLEDIGKLDLRGIHWVIVGGESGPGARPMHPDWARSLRDQCVEAGVRFHFKQWGEYGPFSRTDGIHELPWGEYNAETKFGFLKLGKKEAGCLLDGREWKQFPTATTEGR